MVGSLIITFVRATTHCAAPGHLGVVRGRWVKAKLPRGVGAYGSVPTFDVMVEGEGGGVD